MLNWAFQNEVPCLKPLGLAAALTLGIFHVGVDNIGRLVDELVVLESDVDVSAALSRERLVAERAGELLDLQVDVSDVNLEMVAAGEDLAAILARLVGNAPLRTILAPAWTCLSSFSPGTVGLVASLERLKGDAG